MTPSKSTTFDLSLDFVAILPSNSSRPSEDLSDTLRDIRSCGSETGGDLVSVPSHEEYDGIDDTCTFLGNFVGVKVFGDVFTVSMGVSFLGRCLVRWQHRSGLSRKNWA